MSASSPHGGEPATTIDPAEAAKFGRMAARWWAPDGPMAPLFQLNPARLSYIRGAVTSHFPGRSGRRPFDGLRMIDVGCGGGLVAEPLARLGGEVTGLDASEEAIAAARAHAKAGGLDIRYRSGEVAELVAEGEAFDVVICLEVVEHVADVEAFLSELRRLLKPGGLLIFSTPNRTAKSYLSVIVGAEYVLRWLPRGTHDWRRFLTPDELMAKMTSAGLEVDELKGLSYRPLRRGFELTDDLSVNYIGRGRPVPLA